MTAERLQSAGEYLNNVLVSKGYIREEERIVFLTDGDENIRTNTRRTVNVIYALLTSVDQSNREREAMKLKLKDAETEVGKSLKKIAHLEGRTDALERQIISQEHASSATLRSLAEEKKWRAHYKDQVSKIKSQTGQLQRRFETELRKKQVENSRLRERLLEPRRSSPGTISSVLSTRYNSYGSSPASRPATSDNDNGQLTDEILSLNRKLVEENEALMSQLARIQNGIAQLTTGKVAGDDEMIWESAGAQDCAGVSMLAARAHRVGDEVSESLSQISEILYAPNFVSLAEMRAKERENEALRQELVDVTAKWQRALQTMEEWKSLRSNGGSGKTQIGRSAAKRRSMEQKTAVKDRQDTPKSPHVNASQRISHTSNIRPRQSTTLNPSSDSDETQTLENVSDARDFTSTGKVPTSYPLGTSHTSLARSPLKINPSPLRLRRSFAPSSPGPKREEVNAT